jgi:hypothetical protein
MGGSLQKTGSKGCRSGAPDRLNSFDSAGDASVIRSAAAGDVRLRRHNLLSHCLRSAATLPGAVVSLLPSFTCPACITAYTGILSFLGFTFLLTTTVQVYLISSFFTAGVASMAWSSRTHRRLGPLVLTLAGSVAVLLGRFAWNVQALVYAGIALLLAGAVWNFRLKRTSTQALVGLTLDPKASAGRQQA